MFGEVDVKGESVGEAVLTHGDEAVAVTEAKQALLEESHGLHNNVVRSYERLPLISEIVPSLLSQGVTGIGRID
ncbi:MAG: hypothetical protein NW208_12575 [Bryobacter sp.]|nr:hypothetical protein [Bryobacter sp.]